MGSPEGRSFDGRHGNGLLLNTGDADVLNWPDNTASLGAGLRGGYAYNYDFQTSNRSAAAFNLYPFNLAYGIRGGRTTLN